MSKEEKEKAITGKMLELEKKGWKASRKYEGTIDHHGLVVSVTMHKNGNRLFLGRYPKY